MTADIPLLKCNIRKEFLYNQQSHFNELEQAYVFGITSIKGRCLQFQAMLQSGAHFRALPLHALINNNIIPEKVYSLTDLQLWDCFSFKPIVTVWNHLLNYECFVYLRNKEKVNGVYKFTVDWLPDSNILTSELMLPEQNKCAHVIELENGQYAAQPTNRIIWKDAYFIGNNPEPEKQGYIADDHIWQAETCNKWDVSNTDNVHY